MLTATSVFLSDCGINAHKHCKDLVVMECRSKANVACNRRLDSLSSNGMISLHFHCLSYY